MNATIIPLHLAHDTGDDLIEDSSPIEEGIKILQYHFPRLVNDCIMLAQRPVHFHWDPTIGTAATDCLAQIWMSPHFFLEDLIDIGYGTAYHECGHILHSPYGTKLLQEAEAIGGATLKHIVNIVVDRKDDILTAAHAPGFASTLRNRLAYICTMTRRGAVKAHLEALAAKRAQQSPPGRVTAPIFDPLAPENFERIMKSIKPSDPYEDFFFAAKWHKRPRTRAVKKAMKYLSARRLLNASPAKILWLCQKIRAILGDPPDVNQEQAEAWFIQLCRLGLAVAGRDPAVKLDPRIAQALQAMIKQYVATVRKGGLERLLGQLKAASMVHPGPISVGRKEKVPVRTVSAGPQHAAAYEQRLVEVQPLVDPLIKTLRKLDNPSEFTIYGQDEGDLDFAECARIATGLSGYHQETVTERDINAEIHLALDCSGSMTGEKLEQAKQIATVFTEAMLVLGDDMKGHLWAFSSRAIYDYGPVSKTSAFTTAEGEEGNSDTHMLAHVGGRLAKSRQRRRVLLVLGDDGPDDMKLAAQMSRQLMARGIVVVHLLVGVHGTPEIYPFELVYTSMAECLDQFGSLLEAIIKNLK